MTHSARIFQLLLVTTIAVTGLAACPLKGKKVPSPNMQVPFELKYPDRDQSVKWLDGERRLFLGSRNFKIPPNDETWLYFTEGKMKGESFVATGLLVGRLGEGSWFKDGDWLTEPCQGSVTVAKDGVRFDVSGSKDCEAYSGHFKPTAKKPAAPPDPACGNYTTCVCALEREWAKQRKNENNPFVSICAEARKLLETAEDDPGTCKTGIVAMKETAKKFGVSAAACD